jgi:integrase
VQLVAILSVVVHQVVGAASPVEKVTTALSDQLNQGLPPRRGGRKPKTRSGYDSLLRTLILPRFAHLELSKIRPVDIQEWVASLVARGLSPSRIRQAYYLVGAISKSAVESGFVVKSPVIGVKLPRATMRAMRFLKAEEVDDLADAIAEPYSTLIYVLAYGGLRWGETAALRRSRCDLLRSRLNVVESLADADGQLYFGATKTYSSRSIALPPFLRDKLAEHLAKKLASTANSGES